jgi:mono/diheme cytochrome c family protein
MAHVLVLTLPGLALLSGCSADEAYPTDLTYSLRTDPIVVKVPGGTPWETNRPGQLDQNIAKFNDKEMGGQTLDPKDMSAKERQELDTALRAIFGTPAEPRVKPEDSDAQAQATELKLDKDTLEAGSKVYRRHCMHCHGVPGDGRGPTGPWVNPHPRDYRQGIFKFISTDITVSDRKPRREDIHRTLERGIEGTSMPSFSLLEEKEKEQLISYVMHLSLRGEVELSTMSSILKKEDLGGTIAQNVQDLVKLLVGNWAESNNKPLQPAPYKAGSKKEQEESIRRGYVLFTDIRGAGSCIGCHLDFGRQVPFRYDKWGSLVRPANLTTGVYRGGRRPVDLYWRIKGGILGAEMPKAQFEQGTDKNADPFWDVVNFVQALPYPQMLPEDIKEQIYPLYENKPAAHAQR